MVVLIHEGGRKYFRDLGLVEVLWKSTTSIINWWMTSTICYHDTLHGLRTGHWAGTTTLEAKLIQQLMDIREKSYDALDWDR